MNGDPPPSDAAVTVLLVDDIASQAAKIQRCLRPYRVFVEWRASYRAAVEVLRDPDVGQLVDLILIDQAFDVDAVPAGDLLTASEVGTFVGTEAWDTNLHQGLFILARLIQDMKEGVIPFTPMMILTDYAKVELASQALGLGVGYQSKRRLVTGPYAAIQRWLPQIRPLAGDVDARLRPLVDRGRLDDELAGQVREKILAGLDLGAVCQELDRLPDPNDWAVVGRALDRLAEAGRPPSVEWLAAAVEGAWLPSPQGWLRISAVESVGALHHGFEMFRLQMAGPQAKFSALLAASAVAARSAPAVRELRGSFRMLRQIDPRNHPFRLMREKHVILGTWLRAPESPGDGALAAARRLGGVTRHVRQLHGRALAHGSLGALTAAYERPVFGGLRYLAGEQDLEALRRDDLLRLPGLAATAFADYPPDGARPALERWERLIADGDLEAAGRALEAARLPDEAPSYYDTDAVYSGGEAGFRNLLLASLRGGDAVLREVLCQDATSVPVDFVVCVGGAVAVIEHRLAVSGAALDAATAGRVGPGPAQAEAVRLRRSLDRCRKTARVLARRIEAGLGLPNGAVHQLPAVVVADRAAFPPGPRCWDQVLHETEAIAELTRRSREARPPRGVDMARFVARPAAGARPRQARSRGLHWAAIPVGVDMLRMQTWRKQWRPDAWAHLLRTLANARDALQRLAPSRRPFPLEALRAFDDEAALRDIETEAALVDWVEYDVRVPSAAAPLANFPDAGAEASRRTIAAGVLRGVLAWERAGLAYRTMGPEGALHGGGHVHFDMLSAVVPLDAEAGRRQRRGAAACLVLLLAPWPYAWPAVLAGTTPMLHELQDEGSAWGIGASAVAALLEPERDAAALADELVEKAELLDAAARLDWRFPAVPSGLPKAARP
jgi:hypothetical protein